MQTITKQEFLKHKKEFYARIKKGAVFIYPTDTIYGIGCDATDKKAVERIREIKKRPSTPFSVIAPSKTWVKEQCVINKKAQEWLKKLPGPYTLILQTRSSEKRGTLGVRIPNHWVSTIAKEMKVPIITTSVNVSGEPPLASLEELPLTIARHDDFFINEGRINGRPSTLVNLTEENVSLKKR